MDDIAGYVAPLATMIAAMMTASNLGARVTGWGFVVFTIGSISWSVVAIASDQQNLLWSNGFLTIVNAIGIWRWLGRQTRYRDSGAIAAARSARARAPSLLATSRIKDAELIGSDGQAIGTIVEAMVRCEDQAMAYVVVSEGGVGGVGERLHAVPCSELIFSGDGVRCDLSAEMLRERPEVHGDDWPVTVPPAGSGG